MESDDIDVTEFAEKSAEVEGARLKKFDSAKSMKVETEGLPNLLKIVTLAALAAQTLQINGFDLQEYMANEALVPLINYHLTGAGLQNLGSTCYLNSVLQCLMHTVPFVNGIFSDAHSLHCSCSLGEFCVLCSLREIIRSSFTSGKRSVQPTKLVENLSHFSASFNKGKLEDAHEFFEGIRNSLMYNSPKSDDNLITQVFGGLVVNKIKCKCGNKSKNFERSFDLHLPIENEDSLLEALHSYTEKEKIEFRCEKCGEKTTADKKVELVEVPSIATFHLKRFDALSRKINKHVAFPLELDLLPFTSLGYEERMYNLYAIIVHQGKAMNIGHYYSFICLSSPNDEWFKFDDAEVSRVNERDVLSQEAYILFYAMKGFPSFSEFILTQNFDSSLQPLVPAAEKNLRGALSDMTLHDGVEQSRCRLLMHARDDKIPEMMDVQVPDDGCTHKGKAVEDDETTEARSLTMKSPGL